VASEEVGLRLHHSRLTDPGYHRLRRGRGFRYLDARGEPLRDSAELARIRGLVIPPAWRDVWICTRANGHLQAVGTDEAGRRQYLYHPQFRAEQEQEQEQEQVKHEHVLDVAEALPAVREAVEAHPSDRGLTRRRVSPRSQRLLDLGFFRIGNERYTEPNSSYGLTLLREYSRCQAGAVVFTCTGKHGKEIARTVADPAACRTLNALLRRRGGGDRLLAY
jgi:DNA topoisomerase IB